MYAASIAKLGVLYYAQERLSPKEIIKLSNEYQYTSTVNGFFQVLMIQMAQERLVR